jgi:cobalt/nickel transport protein
MWKIGIIVAALSIAASAHFEVLYTPTVEVVGKEITINNFFTHPYDGAPLMESGLSAEGKVLGLKEAFLVHKGVKTDLTKDLVKTDWSAGEQKGPGFDITLNRNNGFKSAGDYAVVIVPHPYWEPEENLYIQQITKLFINKGGFGEEWSSRVAEGHNEITPLVRPYDLAVGSLFRAVVLDNEDKPVEGVTVEVEYLNTELDTDKKVVSTDKIMSDDKRGIATMVTDVNGIFAFIPQKAGYWGFAALSAGSDKEYKGKELEQDPVIWIQVAE